MKPGSVQLGLAGALIGSLAVISVLALMITGLVPPVIGMGLILFHAVAVLVLLRMVRRDTRGLLSFAERLAETPTAQTAPVMGSAVANDIAQAMARAHQLWLDRDDADVRRAAAAEAVLETLHDPLILLNDARDVLRANQAARSLLGERMVGRDLAGTLRNPTLLEAVDAVLAGGASRTVEVLLPVPVERTLEARVKPFRPAGADQPLQVLLTLHDVTVLKRSEQMRADFVANASHELRTPLAALIGFIETLRGPAKDDRAAHEKFLGIMFDQANRMSRLVNDLMSLSRIEMDEHSPPTGAVDVARIVRNLAVTLEMRAASRKVKLRVDSPDSLPLVVGDEDQLSQVFQNLIDNAIKYGKEQTEVTVTLSANDPAGGGSAAARALAGRGTRGPSITVAVTDRGEGIARTHLPRLTERFYRVDPARSRALGGTGLGLAIVKHIVNRHRGRLIIDSEVGKGSTFTVLLPAMAGTGGEIPAQQAG